MISAVAARKAAVAIQASGPPLNSTPPLEEENAGLPSCSNDAKSSRKKKRKRGRKVKPYERTDKRNERGKSSIKDENIPGFIVGAGVGDLELDLSEGCLDNTHSMAQSKDPSPVLGLPTAEPSEDEDDGAHEPQFQLDVSALLPELTALRPVLDESPEETILSNFQPDPGQNMYFLSDLECSTLGLSFPATLVCLRDEDKLCLLGICELTILTGAIDLCGTSLEASDKGYRIFSPRCSPLPIIQARSNFGSSFTLPWDLIPDRLRGLSKFKAVLGFQALATGVAGLGQICRPFEAVFEPPKGQKDVVSSPFEIPDLYMVSRSTKELSPFTLPPTWSSALDHTISTERNQVVTNSLPGVYIVKGPKNSGKSTLARTLTNRLLGVYRRVAFLECDIGQTEFTPPGIVSLNVISEPLFGPPFTHPTLPNFAHFIGATSPRSSPAHYLDAVSALIETYRHEVQIQTPLLSMTTTDEERADSPYKISDVFIPLVVNTMGWVKGLGADLNQKIESTLEPTGVFHIQAPSRGRGGSGPSFGPRYDEFHHSYGAFCDIDDVTMMDDGPARQIHVLDAALNLTTTTTTTTTTTAAAAATARLTAADHRNISFLSYFHALFPKNHTFSSQDPPLDQITARKWDTSRPLCAIPPFEVDCSVAFDSVILTGAGSEDVVEDEISTVLNAAVVGLVACEPGTMTTEHEDSKALKTLGIPYTRAHQPPPPVSSTCVGVGVIRGVSPPRPVSDDGSEGSSSSTAMKTLFHLLTPTPHSLLGQARVLVKGEVELPIWGMLDFRTFFKEGEEKEVGSVAGVELENVPYLQWGPTPVGAFGAGKRKVRRNLMRKGQM